MNKNYISLFVIILFVLTVFATAELIRKYLKLKTEITRKFAHIVAGLITLSFPALFSSHIYVFILAASFFGLLVLSKRYMFLNSINSINRISYGSIVFPLAIYTCFLAYTYTGHGIYYYLPVILLTISDPMAAIVGMETNWKPFHIGKETKTLSGSTAFFISALILCYICLHTAHVHNYIVIQTLIIALATTATEAISTKGLDNIWVPLAAMTTLYCMGY